MLQERPFAYLDEISWFVYDEFDIQVSEDTIARMLNRHQWPRKQIKRVAAQRNEHLRLLWRRQQLDWSPERMVFVDETAACERNGWRKYGWSLRGAPCYNSQPLKRSERWSVLPAIGINGHLDKTLIHRGSITAALFEDWLEFDILPQCDPDTILVMDNASIHRSPRIDALCARFYVNLKYLPPYSPDLNPIESSFAELKAWIRRHAEEAVEFSDFADFLRKGINSLERVHAQGYWYNCGYRS